MMSDFPVYPEINSRSKCSWMFLILRGKLVPDFDQEDQDTGDFKELPCLIKDIWNK